MSLDIYLKSKVSFEKPPSSGIFVREHGKTIEISEKQWYERHPDREPVRILHESETDILYHDNITHNLVEMAKEAAIYELLWKPEELGFTKANQLSDALQLGLKILITSGVKLRQFNPKNGWGSYEQLVGFVTGYLGATLKYPDATVEVSR